MKTKYKHLFFVQNGEKWDCRNGKEKYWLLLGVVHYNLRWKCFEFWPEERMAFTDDCLTDIADFLKQLNEEKSK